MDNSSKNAAPLLFSVREYYYRGYMEHSIETPTEPTKKRRPPSSGKRSIQAKQVALDVIAKVGKGVPINKTEIQIKNGYSLASAQSGKALGTDSYKETIAKFVNRVENERSRIMLEMSGRDLSSERYSTLMDSMDKLTKVSQLLQGKSTENIAGIINVVRYNDTDDQIKEKPAS